MQSYTLTKQHPSAFPVPTNAFLQLSSDTVTQTCSFSYCVLLCISSLSLTCLHPCLLSSHSCTFLPLFSLPPHMLFTLMSYTCSPPVSCRLSRGTLLTTSFIVLSRSSARGTSSYGSSSAVSMAVRRVGRIQAPN